MKMLLLLVAAAALAQSATAPPAKPIAPPAISDALRAKFWRATNDLNELIGQLQTAKAKQEEAVADLRKACGDRPLIQDQTREPQCGDTPAPVQPAAAKPKPKLKENSQ